MLQQIILVTLASMVVAKVATTTRTRCVAQASATRVTMVAMAGTAVAHQIVGACLDAATNKNPMFA
jgi:hypothetical protein